MPRISLQSPEIDPEWKKFEKFVRDIFIKANFEDTIQKEDSWFRLQPNGNQIDVFGGADNVAIVLDCTITNDPDGTRSLQDKITKTVIKKPRIEEAIKNRFGNKYKKTIFVIATKGINVGDGERTVAAQHKIGLIDYDFFKEAKIFLKEAPEQVKYQILKKLGEKIKFVKGDEAFGPLLNQPALKFSSGNFVGYALAIPVSLLLRLAYVHRLETDISRGYQRKINVKKIININDFLTQPDNFFVNSLLVAFDQEPKVTTVNGSMVQLELPSEYASCEIIDGQHRLYGYVPLKKGNGEEIEKIKNRQYSDVIPVIAVVDKEHNLRHRLFLDINANQKPVDPIHIWTQYGGEHPEVERGYISNILKKMDENGPLSNSVFKVGDPKQKKKIATISFLGGVLEKTRILDKENPQSIVFVELRNRKYPQQIDARDPTIKILNDFFNSIKECSGDGWPSGRYSTSLIKSSYGLSIFIELFPHIKNEFEYRRMELTKENFKKIFINIREFLIEKDRDGKPLWEKSTLTSAGTRRKAMKHFIEKYLLTLNEWKDSRIFKNILNN